MSILNDPYKGDYDHTPEVDKKGRFRDRFFYKGDLYVLPFDEDYKKRTYPKLISYGAGMFATLILQGLINQNSSRTIWVVLPYIVQFLPVLYFLLGVVEYIGAPIRMTRAQYDKSVGRMHFCAEAEIVLSFISEICALVYFIKYFGAFSVIREQLFITAHLLPMCVAYRFGKYYDRHFILMSVEKNE